MINNINRKSAQVRVKNIQFLNVFTLRGWPCIIMYSMKNFHVFNIHCFGGLQTFFN